MPLQIIRQDITKMKVDAIVNTTNEEMVGYSGVDLAVHEGAGPELDLECEKIAPLGLGQAKITKGYNLDAKYIIHTSGPIWEGGLRGESVLLRSCYLESLRLAVEYGCETVAFPLISSGVYGYPKDQVLKFAVQVISEFLMENELSVYICVYDRTSYEFSKTLYRKLCDFIYGEREIASAPKILCASAADPTPKKKANPLKKQSLKEYMKSVDKSFAYKLFDLIDERGMTDSQCYNKANVDRKTFSKLRCNPDTYKPSKQTAVAFAIALELDIDQTQELLASAGLTLSDSFVFDKIIRYFIQNGIYNVFEINEALFEFDQTLLGC